MMMLNEVEGLGHEQFGGALLAEAFSRAGVELPGHGIVVEAALRCLPA